MAVYKVLKGTPGILVAEDGARRNFTTKRDLDFGEMVTNGPFEGLYIFERGDNVIYIDPRHVSIVAEVSTTDSG